VSIEKLQEIDFEKLDGLVPAVIQDSKTTLDDVRALLAMNIDVAIGMAIYTGGLSLAELLTLKSR
jgi:phosphoribosylformimino-5-aminoimidazole carboxamide ribonucleotide (ProFAR) isomerase